MTAGSATGGRAPPSRCRPRPPATGGPDPQDPPAVSVNPDVAIDTAGIRPELAAERIFARLQCLGYLP